jgi:hypothetical protein
MIGMELSVDDIHLVEKINPYTPRGLLVLAELCSFDSIPLQFVCHYHGRITFTGITLCS